MNKMKNIFTAIAILVLDTITFFAPMTAIFAAYVLIFKPEWFKNYIDSLYSTKD